MFRVTSYKASASIRELRACGVQFEGGLAVMYRGTDIPNQMQEDLRYGDFLSSVESGTDVTGNQGADSYGSYVYKFLLQPEYLKVTNGELQYVGPSHSMEGGQKYPQEIYRAFNDSLGSNYTAQEIDAMSESEVRGNASMALPGGKEEFNQLLQKSRI